MTVIHAHDTLPPIITDAPVSYDGCTGLYWEATREGAEKAVAWHQRNFPDREVDSEVLALTEARPMAFIEALTKASSMYEAIIYPVGERDDHAYRVKAGQIRLIGSRIHSLPVKDYLERDWVVEEVSE